MRTTSRLAEMIRIYLAAYRMTQKKAAEEIGITESTLSRFLEGKAMPDAHGFMRIVVWAALPPTWKDHTSPEARP
jgi:transcriptional regulator with XRE-family HTH domain